MSVDISGIKTDIKSILDVANTTTAATDLSSGLVRRVQSVNKYNPEKVKPTGNDLPSLFLWAQAKRVSLETINVSLSGGKRRARLLFSVAGVVWVPYSATVTEDPADTDCEKLMENVEEILRANDTLGGKVKWHQVSDVTYHTAQYDEEAHLRVGIMALETTIYY